MKFDYEYKIQLIDYKGLATVEYSVKQLGTITRVFFLPWSLGKDVVERICKEKFPIEMFFSRWQSTSGKAAPDDIINLRGKGSIDYNDYYYTLNADLLSTSVINNENKAS